NRHHARRSHGDSSRAVRRRGRRSGECVAMILSRVVLLVLLVIATASCGASAPAERTRPLIGVTLLTQTHAFFKDLEDSLRAEAERHGYDVVVVACEMDPARQ